MEIDLTRVGELQEEVERLSLDRFKQHHPHPFLLVETPEKNADDLLFSTVPPSSATGDADEEGPSTLASGESYVFTVDKSQRNAFQGMVSVGRAGNNDIVIDHPSISKFHAFFRHNPQGSTYSLTDAGSKNGTFVNETPLAPNTAAPVESGQRIRFGEVIRGTFYSPEDLYAYLESLGTFEAL